RIDGHRNRVKRSPPVRILINMRSTEGNATCYTFPFAVFEAAILDRLAELNPRDVLPGAGQPDETMVLSGELARVKSSISALVEEMEAQGESAALFKRLREKESAERELAGKLADARQRAAHPLSECWGEAQSLARMLEQAPDPEDVRVRLRSALRRIVVGIWILVVPVGRRRLCAAQIWFAEGDRHR